MKKWLIRIVIALIAAVLVEQFIILPGLGKQAVRQQVVHLDYITKLGPPLRPYDENDVGVLAYKCVSKRIGFIYSYRLCVKTARRQPNGNPQYYLVVIKPAGYLTLVPWNSGDRILWDGVYVFLFYDGKITQRISVRD